MPEMKQGETSAAARFGEFEFDPRRGVLSRKGAVLKLQPQPFRVLELLLARAPNIVTREELGAFIWGDEVHVDLEQSINYCVRQIRSVLDDSASNPRYIDTLPKQGYRFIAEVIREAAPVKAAEPTESSPPAVPIAVDPAILMPASVADSPKLSRRSALWMGGAALLAGGGIWIGRSLSGRRREGAVNVVLPLPAGAAAADPGLVLGPPVVAPDGSAVIVSLKTAEGNYLFIRRLDTNRLIRMEGTLHGNQPFWSPDSQHVAFFADAKLKRMPIAGGSPVVLCEASVPRGGSWGSSGVLLFGLNFNGLFQVPEGGGTASAVTHLDLTAGENSHRNPAFLPDGDRFLYLARTDDVERRAIYMDSLKHSSARQRIGAVDGQFALGRDPDGDVYYLISQQAGKIVAQGFDVARGAMSGTSRVLLDRTGSVSVSETGVLVIRTDQQLLTRILLLNRSGQQLGSVGEPSDYWSVALSPDGRSVLTDRHDSLSGQFKVWTASLSSGLLEPVSDSNHASFPLWSHNGDSMYFTDIRERTLLRRTVSPKGPEQKVMNLNDARRILVEDVSPDERYVVAEIAPDGAHSEICWSELNQTPQWHMVGATGPLGLHPRFSPDGRWLAVTSNETGQSEIYVMDFPGGTRRQRISSDHGHTPRWRRDGKELFYVAGDGSVMSVDLGNGQDLQAATPKRLFHVNFRLSSNEPLYDVTGDGQRFLVIDGENKASSDSDIEMVLHWPSLLPR